MFSAYYLARNGFTVTVLDRNLECETSANNAGFIVPSSAPALPVGIVEILSTYLGRQNPVYISPNQLLRNLGWLLQARKSLETSAKTIIGFGRKSLELYTSFFNEERVNVDLQRGVTYLYKNAELGEKAARELNGRVVGEEEALKLGFTGFGGGVEFEQEFSINPAKLCVELRKKLSTLGVTLLLGKGAQLNGPAPRIDSVKSNGEELHADFYVLAAGAWSRPLCRDTGYDPPIIPARGLVMHFETGGETVVGRPVMLEDYGLPVIQHDRNTVRVTGFFELRGFDETFTDSRKNWLLGIVKNHLLGASKLRFVGEGVGYRPCTPDQLPIIGKVPGYENLFIASGHCRLGVTLAAATGDMVRALMEGKTENWMKDFDPERFAV